MKNLKVNVSQSSTLPKEYSEQCKWLKIYSNQELLVNFQFQLSAVVGEMYELTAFTECVGLIFKSV